MTTRRFGTIIFATLGCMQALTVTQPRWFAATTCYSRRKAQHSTAQHYSYRIGHTKNNSKDNTWNFRRYHLEKGTDLQDTFWVHDIVRILFQVHRSTFFLQPKSDFEPHCILHGEGQSTRADSHRNEVASNGNGNSRKFDFQSYRNQANSSSSINPLNFAPTPYWHPPPTPTLRRKQQDNGRQRESSLRRLIYGGS